MRIFTFQIFAVWFRSKKVSARNFRNKRYQDWKTFQKIHKKKGKVMGKKFGQGKKLVWFFFLILVLAFIGCGQQQSAPPAAPPSSGAQAPATAPPPPAGQPAPTQAAPAQPAPSSAAPVPATPTQTPPAGASQPSPTAAPSQDLKQLYLGMPADQAQAIMGAPGETRPGKGVTRWFYPMPQGKVEIRVRNNQVVAIELE
jgi:hypothetical protein